MKVEVKNFKFGMQVCRKVYYLQNAKLGQRGRELGHVSYF